MRYLYCYDIWKRSAWKISERIIVHIRQHLGDLKKTVVYFDQQTHACACVSMVENDEKHWKMIEKSTFFIMCTRGTREAYEEKQRKKFDVFYRFQPCKRMRKHVFAGRNTQQKTYLGTFKHWHVQTLA